MPFDQSTKNFSEILTNLLGGNAKVLTSSLPGKQTARKGVRSITIHFDEDGNAKNVDICTDITDEKSLSSVLALAPFQDISIKKQNGKIVSVKSTVKTRLPS